MTRQKAQQLLIAVISALLLTTTCFVAAQRGADPETRFRDALRKQQVEGDLNGAIEIYREIAASSTANRALKARALLQLGTSLETQGQQAQAVYERILKEFEDQPAASQARTKLAALKPPAAPPSMTLRKIEIGNGIRNVVASDGKRVVYWDSANPANPALVIDDVAGKEKRVILQTREGPRPYVSRDLSMVFLYFPMNAEGPQRFAVIKTDGTGYRELKLTEDGSPFHVEALGPSCGSWSWDNRHLLMCKPESGGARLIKFSVAGGEVQNLLDRADPEVGLGRAEFSPDNRFIVWGGSWLGPIYIVPAQGGKSLKVAQDALFMDWTADGRFVLVGEPTSDSSIRLSALSISEGHATGESVNLRSVPGMFSRTAVNGALIVRPAPTSNREVSLGVMDAEEKSLKWTTMSLIGNPFTTAFAAWSPDNSRFAYLTGEPTSTTRIIRVKDIVSGNDRELYRHERLVGCAWAYTRPVLYCAQPSSTATEILTVSVDTGRAEVVASLDAPHGLDHISTDDRVLFMPRSWVDWSEWEIGTDRRTTISFFRSPDRRWNFRVESGDGMEVQPIGGSDRDWKV
ncbi:MAG TPA: hypothetical protein VMT78_11830, partial [Terriglobia bacterium]|nr:hypothetical protein [Terriglobia bacterium]